MHELPLALLPALAVPAYAARLYISSRRARRSAAARIGGRVRPRLRLRSPDGTQRTLDDVAGRRATVIVFMSNQCPGVKAYDGRLAAMARQLAPQGVRLLGVNSVPESLYPGESLAGMAQAAAERGLPFAYLKDEDQRLQRALGAVCTPQAFLLDGKRRLRYRGRIDDAFVEERVRFPYLRDAVQAVLDGGEVPNPETHATGCAIDYASPSPLVVEAQAARPMMDA